MASVENQVGTFPTRTVPFKTELAFSKNRPLGPILFLELRCLSVCLFVPFSCMFFLGLWFALRSHDHTPDLHWPSGHMIRSRPLFGPPDPLTKNMQSCDCFFLKINHATSPKFYRSYCPHWSRDSLSPVCGIFLYCQSPDFSRDCRDCVSLHSKQTTGICFQLHIFLSSWMWLVYQKAQNHLVWFDKCWYR